MRRGRAFRRRVAQRQLARDRRGRSCRRTWSAPTRSWRRSAATASDFTTSRPTRSTATSRSTTRPGSRRTRRTTRRARTRAPRPAPTCWSAPGCAASASRRRSATARTTTAPTSTSRSSSRARSPRSSTGRRPKLYGAGENVRDWIHAEDHSSGVLAILERGRIGETYLIGADGERRNRDVVELILRADGPRSERLRPRQRPARPRSSLRDRREQAPRRARLAAGIQDFEQGLAATIDWYRDNEAWWRPQKDATEAKYQVLGR